MLFRYSLLAVVLSLVIACEEPAESSPAQPASNSFNPTFQLLSPSQTGVKFVNALPENDEFNILSYEYYFNGGGVAIGDVNGDELPDILFTANLIANRLFLNRGNFRFEEVSKASGLVSRPGWKTGVTMADVNADGHLDVYVCRSGNLGEDERRNELFLNRGDGTFREAAAEFGLDDPGYSNHAAFLDYDRDGDLDCFVLNHALKPDFNLEVSQIRQQRHPFFGDHLYRNDGGAFVDVSESAGLLGNAIGFGLSVTVEDYDRDGWLDLFVGNDYTEQDYLYHNQQDGTFREVLNPAMAHTSHFSMGSDAGDVNGDGWPDLVVLDMLPEDNYGQKILMGPDNYNKFQMQVDQGFYYQYMRNTLQVNLGKGLNQGMAFSEIGQLMGISNTDWSWSPLLADFDNDGDLDLHITNGYVRASTHLDFVKYDYPAALRAAQESGRPLRDGEVSTKIPSIHKPNVVFRNDGPDRGFVRVSREWGFQQPSFSQGAAYGDLDQDGDLDLVVNNLRSPAFIYQNNTFGHSLCLRLSGPTDNPGAIGAVVTAWVGNTPHRRILMPSRGYLSSVEPVIHIGLGEAKQADRVEIVWPNGDYQVLGQPLPAGAHELRWKDGLPPFLGEEAFEAITLEQGFIHRENQAIDFHTQPLLLHMPGRMGPCLAGQVTGKGKAEVFVGGGSGQRAMLLRVDVHGSQDSDLRWEEVELPGTEEAEMTDIICFDADGDDDQDVYLVGGGNDLSPDGSAFQDQLLIREGNQFSLGYLPDMAFSGGCVAAGDADGDGDLDLFVGGRVTPGAYPTSPPSAMLINDGSGGFSKQISEFFDSAELGMVTDAAWADLDQDGRDELLLVGEWEPVRIFGWNNGAFVEQSRKWGMVGSEGWWTRLEVADLDQDGDLDLLTGNMGTNSQLHASAQEPMRMYADDFDNNGTIDPVITHFLEGKEVPIAARDELLGQLRYLQRRFNRYEQYARASIDQIFSAEELLGADPYEVRELRSGWWEQDNGSFVFHPWPMMAQAAPVFGQQVADLNADGYSDVLLAGNYYPMRAENGRFDASTGVVLYGTGGGAFRQALPGQEQGLWLEGDIRDLLLLNIGAGDHVLVAARNHSPWLWGRWLIENE